MKRSLLPLLAAFALGATACGGVSHAVRSDVAQPRSIAVLPFAGEASPTLRAAARQLLTSRLLTRGYEVPETAWVDRVLSERGWLRDPERPAPTPLPIPLADVLQALGTDAVALGTDLDESSFNILVLRRHAVGGRVAITDAQGREYWSTTHGSATLGGFLLTSGQVFTELRAQAEHGTPMASLALTDEFVADIAGTVPERQDAARPTVPPPTIAHVRATRTRGSDGERIVVEAEAPRGTTLRFELAPHLAGVPMAELPDQPGHYRGAQELPVGTTLARVTVRARDAYGRETTQEGSL